MDLSSILKTDLKDLLGIRNKTSSSVDRIHNLMRKKEEEYLKRRDPNAEGPINRISVPKKLSDDLYNFFALNGDIYNKLTTADNTTEFEKALKEMLRNAAKNSKPLLQSAKKNYFFTEEDEARLLQQVKTSEIAEKLKEIIDFAAVKSNVIYSNQNYRRILFDFIKYYKEESKGKGLGRQTVVKPEEIRKQDILPYFGVTENQYKEGLSEREAMKAIAKFMGKGVLGHPDEESHFVFKETNPASKGLDDRKKKELIFHFLSGQRDQQWLDSNINDVRKKAEDFFQKYNKTTDPLGLSEADYRKYFGLKGTPTADMSVEEAKKAIDYILGQKRAIPGDFNSKPVKITVSGKKGDEKKQIEDYLSKINDIDEITKAKYIYSFLTDFKNVKEEAGNFKLKEKNFVTEDIGRSAAAIYKRRAQKEEKVEDPGVSDLETLKQEAKRLETRIDALDDILYTGELTEEGKKIDELMEGAVPTDDDVEPYISRIKEAYRKVDLPDSLKKRFLDIDPKTFTYKTYTQDDLKDLEEKIDFTEDSIEKFRKNIDKINVTHEFLKKADPKTITKVTENPPDKDDDSPKKLYYNNLSYFVRLLKEEIESEKEEIESEGKKEEKQKSKLPPLLDVLKRRRREEGEGRGTKHEETYRNLDALMLQMIENTKKEAEKEGEKLSPFYRRLMDQKGYRYEIVSNVIEKSEQYIQKLKDKLKNTKEDLGRNQERKENLSKLVNAKGSKELQDAVDDYATYIKGFDERAKSLRKKDVPRLEALADAIKSIIDSTKFLLKKPKFFTTLAGATIFQREIYRKDKIEDTDDQDKYKDVMEKREKLRKKREEMKEKYGPAKSVDTKDISEEKAEEILQKERARVHPIIRYLDENESLSKLKEFLHIFNLQYSMPWYTSQELRSKFESIVEDLGKVQSELSQGRLGPVYSKINKDLVKAINIREEVVPDEESKRKRKKKKASVNRYRCISDYLLKLAARQDLKAPDWMVYSQKYRPAGGGAAKKTYRSFFDRPDQVSSFIDAISSRSFKFFNQGKEVEEADAEQYFENGIDKIVAEVILRGGQKIEDLVLTKLGEDMIKEADEGTKGSPHMTAYDKLQEANKKMREVNGEIVEVKNKYLPILDDYAKFFNNPKPIIIEQAKKKGLKQEAQELFLDRMEDPIVEDHLENFQKAIINKDIDSVKDYVELLKVDADDPKEVIDDIYDIQKAEFKPYGQKQTDPLAQKVLKDLTTRFRRSISQIRDKSRYLPTKEEEIEKKKERIKEERKEKEKAKSPMWDKTYVRGTLAKFLEKYVPQSKAPEGWDVPIEKKESPGTKQLVPDLKALEKRNQELKEKDERLNKLIAKFNEERKRRDRDFLSSPEAVKEYHQIEDGIEGLEQLTGQEKEKAERFHKRQEEIKSTKEDFKRIEKEFREDIEEAKKALNMMKENKKEITKEDKKAINDINEGLRKYHQILNEFENRRTHIQTNLAYYKGELLDFQKDVYKFQSQTSKGISPRYEQMRKELGSITDPDKFIGKVKQISEFIKKDILVHYRDRYISDLINAVEDYMAKYKEKVLEGAGESVSEEEVSRKIAPFIGALNLLPDQKAKLFQNFTQLLTGARATKKVADEQKSPTDIIEDYVSYPTRGEGPEYKRIEKKLKTPEPKIKDWEVVQHMLGEEAQKLRDIKEETDDKYVLSNPEVFKEMILKANKQLKNVLRKKKISEIEIPIGNKKVPVNEASDNFRELLEKYQGELNKLRSRRRNYQNIAMKSKDTLRDIKRFIDPKTGEFKGFSEEHKETFKNIFYKQLFWDLQRYWMTTVGRHNVFGGREYAPYMQVYDTFKNLVGVRTNPNILEKIRLIDREIKDLQDINKDIAKYRKTEGKDFLEKFENSYKERLLEKRDLEQQLGRIRDSRYLSEAEKKEKTSELLEKLKSDDKYFREEFGAPHKDLRALIEKRNTIQKKKKHGVDELFKMMLDVADKALMTSVLNALKKKIKEDTSEEEAYIEKMREEVKKETEALAKKTEEVTMERETPTEKPVEEKAEKPSEPAELEKEEDLIKLSYREDKNFNSAIFYSPRFQRKLAELAKKEIG